MWNLKTSLVLALLGASLCAGTALYAYKQGRQSGMTHTQQLWDSEKLTVAQVHAIQIQQLNDQLQEAQNRARQRETLLRREADASRLASERLREQLAQADTRIATASAEAVAEYALTVSELFAHCTGAYRDMAEKADGHASDATLLHESWPGRAEK